MDASRVEFSSLGAGNVLSREDQNVSLIVRWPTRDGLIIGSLVNGSLMVSSVSERVRIYDVHL
jgi:hypothetical protein